MAASACGRFSPALLVPAEAGFASRRRAGHTLGDGPGPDTSRRRSGPAPGGRRPRRDRTHLDAAVLGAALAPVRKPLPQSRSQSLPSPMMPLIPTAYRRRAQRTVLSPPRPSVTAAILDTHCRAIPAWRPRCSTTSSVPGRTGRSSSRPNSHHERSCFSVGSRPGSFEPAERFLADATRRPEHWRSEPETHANRRQQRQRRVAIRSQARPVRGRVVGQLWLDTADVLPVQ